MKLTIRQERLKRGWTQEYVAQQIGTTLSSVQKIECGNRKPSYNVLVKLLALFDYSDPRELFGGETSAMEKKLDGNPAEE